MTVRKRREQVSGVYKIQSTIKPSRIYIGSSFDILKRWKNHLWLLEQNRHHSVKLQNHVNKYGVTDLTFNILELSFSYAAVDREQYYINLLDPYFNCSKFATLIGNQDKSITTRVKIGNSNRGKKRSEEQNKRMSELLSSPILQYSLDGIFIKEYSSTSLIEKEFGVGASHILECCKEQRRSAYGFTWRNKTSNNIEQVIFVRDRIHINHPIECYANRIKMMMKKIIQYDLNGIKLQEFNSRKEAASITGVCATSITNCCNGKHKQGGGFIWKYKN